MKRKIVVYALLLFAVVPMVAQPADLRASVSEWLKTYSDEYITLQGAYVRKLNVNAKKKTITLYTNFLVSTVPFRPETVKEMKLSLIHI